MHLSRALSALLAASVLTACATSAAAPSRTPTPGQPPQPPLSTAAPPLSDAQVARRGVLRQSDFPKDWKLNADAGDRLTCRSTTAAKNAAAATARGKAFASGPNTEAQSSAYVYRSTKVAKRHLNRLGGRSTITCVVRAVERAFTDAGGFTVGKIATAALDIGDAGDERLATRITVPISGKGVGADVFIDLVVVRVGRAYALELFVDAFTAFDEQFRANLTATQVRRLKDAQQR
jgi:hypothetical protein